MFNYVLLILFLLTASLLGYYTFTLLKNARASSLYSKVAFMGFLSILSVFINFTMLLIKTLNLKNINIDLYLYSMLVQTIFSYNLFSIWKIRHNQHKKQNYKLPIIILATINITLLFLNSFEMIAFFPNNVFIYLPLIINAVLMAIPNILFIQFNKQSSTSDFTMYPIIIFALILINVGLLLYNFYQFSYVVYFTLILIQSIVQLFMLQVSVKDYQKSFYY